MVGRAKADPSIRLHGNVGHVTKTLLLVGIILLILLLVIPLGIGLAMGTCPQCTVPGAPMGFALCAALVLMVIIVVQMFVTAFRGDSLGPPGVVLVRQLARPPRSS